VAAPGSNRIGSQPFFFQRFGHLTCSRSRPSRSESTVMMPARRYAHPAITARPLPDCRPCALLTECP